MDKTFSWLARGLGLAACLFFGLFAVGEGIPDLRKGAADGRLLVMLVLLSAAVVFYLLAWARPSLGGALLGLTGLGLGLNVLIPSSFTNVRASLIYALPFVVPGLMFVGASRAGRPAGPR